MLNHKNQIKEDADVPQPKFDRVPCDTTPVTLRRRVNNQLHDGEDTASKIQKNLNDTPAGCRLSLVVDPRLRDVLDYRHQQLDIRDGVYLNCR